MAAGKLEEPQHGLLQAEERLGAGLIQELRREGEHVRLDGGKALPQKTRKLRTLLRNVDRRSDVVDIVHSRALPLARFRYPSHRLGAGSSCAGMSYVSLSPRAAALEVGSFPGLRPGATVSLTYPST